MFLYQIKPKSLSFRRACKVVLLSQRRKQGLLDMSTIRTELFQASAITTVFKAEAK